MSLRKAWHMTGFAAHNDYCRERGYKAAIVPMPPLVRRVRRTLLLATELYRERLAIRIAPWLDPEGD